MNLSQLRAQIDRRTGVRQDPLAANSFLNEALNIISSRREWPWLDAVQSITVAADDVDPTIGENTHPVSANYSESRTVNVGGEEAAQIYVADGDDFNGTFFGTSRSEFTIEWNDGTAEITVYPTPPVGTVIIHRYTRTEELLSSDTDLPLLPERYHTVLADLATSLFLERISPPRAEYYRAAAEKGMKQMGEAVQRKTNPGRVRIRDGYPF